MQAATAPPRMRSSMTASPARRPAGIKVHQGKQPEPECEIDEIQHGVLLSTSTSRS
jgi:hypothetical protein